jgi:pilus assembly protein CpaF
VRPDDLLARLRARVNERLAATINGEALTYGQRLELTDRIIDEVLEAHAAQQLAAGRQPPTPMQEQALKKGIQAAMTGLAGFQQYLDDPDIENIIANGCDQVFVRRRGGRKERVRPVAVSDAELIAVIRTAAARLGLGERRFDAGQPALSMRLPNGDRLFAIYEVTDRPCVTIRRHGYIVVTLADLRKLGTIDRGLLALFRALVKGGFNLLIVGGTDVGKTTLLRALLAETQPEERLVTIEDALELNLRADEERHPDVVEMQAREPNVEGEGEIDCAQLVRYSLRMSPDRVIVGEVRGPEIVPMLNAMCQGNDGSLSTIHGSSTAVAFDRIRTFAIQAPERLPNEATNMLIASALHFVIHLGFADDGTRVVTSVREVVGADGLQVISNEIYRPDSTGRAVPGAPIRAATMKTLIGAGYDPSVLERKNGWWDT